MKLMLCADDRYGMRFAGRRQSQDRVLRQEIRSICGGAPLWMNEASAKLFRKESEAGLCIAEDFLSKAGQGEFCFVEAPPVAPFADTAEEIYLFRWNRVYPADEHLDYLPGDHGWSLTELREFPGSSHEKITLEVYTRTER